MRSAQQTDKRQTSYLQKQCSTHLGADFELALTIIICPCTLTPNFGRRQWYPRRRAASRRSKREGLLLVLADEQALFFCLATPVTAPPNAYIYSRSAPNW